MAVRLHRTTSRSREAILQRIALLATMALYQFDWAVLGFGPEQEPRGVPTRAGLGREH